MKVAVLAHIKEYHGNHKKILRVNMVLGDAVSKLEMFVCILNHISRSITWPLFILKLGQMTQSQHDLSYGGASLSIT